VSFVYALSPGLDIVFTSSNDVNALKAKLDQVTCVLYVIYAYNGRSRVNCNKSINGLLRPCYEWKSVEDDIFGSV